MGTLENKVIIITGSSRGIGATVAKGMAKAGAKVVVNYASGKEAAEKVVAEIVDKGGIAIAVQADVSNAGSVKTLFDQVIESYGRVDVLVNNAGIMINKPVKDVTDEDFNRQFDINVKGSFYTMREAVTRLSDKGSIINFSSSTTRMMLPNYGVYVATKGAVEQLSRTLAKEVGARGINVNIVSPGPTNTELFTHGKSEQMIARLASLSAYNRIAEPEDIVPIVVFLASDDAKWITGQNFGVNGGIA